MYGVCGDGVVDVVDYVGGWIFGCGEDDVRETRVGELIDVVCCGGGE